MPTTVIDNSVPASSRPPPGHPGRVLYAEDLGELREVMKLIVQAEGYQIETVGDGDVALELLTKHPGEFDLLITDHHMPRMDGLELVRRLARAGLHQKIMVFSSELALEVHREYHRLGMAVILPKPIRPAVFRRSLHELLAAR